MIDPIGIRSMPLRQADIFFFLAILFLSSWHLDDGPNDNTMSRAATVASLVDHGTLEITPIHEVTGDKALIDGKYFSEKAPLPTFLVLPFHWIEVRSGLVHEGEFGTLTPGLLRLGGFICGSIPFALICTIFWRDRRRAGLTDAWALATLPLFGSFLFVYSGSFYNHLLGSLFILLAARSMVDRKYLVAGLWSGCAFLSEAALLIIPAAWMLQLLFDRWKEIHKPILGLLPSVILMCAFNYSVTGDPIVFPNAFHVNFSILNDDYGFGHWQPETFAGLLITDHRGLLFYMPVLLMALWFIPKRVALKDLLRDPFVLPAILLIAAFLTHATWWGGWAYGPRYLMAAAALLAYSTLMHHKFTRPERWIFFLLCSFGIICAFAAKATVWYSLPSQILHPLFEEIWPRIVRGEFTSMQWPVLLGLQPGVATLLFISIFSVFMYLISRIDRERISANTHRA